MTKVALITGASRGLGQTLADFLAKQDYRLILNARGEKALRESAETLQAHTEVITVVGDIAAKTTRAKLLEAAAYQGGLDLLVNNASLLGPSPQPDLADYSLKTLRQVFEANVFAPLELIQLSLPHLENRGALVVTISSDAAVGAYEGWGGYGATKAALDLISSTLAKELKGRGVSVVSVDPGDMRTDMHQAAFPGEDISDRPLPEVTLPFWAWLLGQDRLELTGQRFRAQAETWTLQKEAA